MGEKGYKNKYADFLILRKGRKGKTGKRKTFLLIKCFRKTISMNNVRETRKVISKWQLRTKKNKHIQKHNKDN